MGPFCHWAQTLKFITQAMSRQANVKPQLLALPLTRDRALAVLGPHLIAASTVWGV